MITTRTVMGLILSSSLLWIGCGMMEPKYVKYDTKQTATGTEGTGGTTETPTEGEGGTTASEGCQAALTAFTESSFKSTAKDGACKSCHVTGGIATPFDVDDDALRKVVKGSSYYDATAATFLANLTASSHAGASAAQGLGEADVSAWLTAEASCTE